MTDVRGEEPTEKMPYNELVDLVLKHESRIRELKKALKVHRSRTPLEHRELAYRGRVGRAAKRMGKSFDEWVKWCKKTGHKDPTALPESVRKQRPQRGIGVDKELRDRLFNTVVAA